jgi:hypothetical protein
VIGFGSVLGSALVIALLLVLRPRLAFNGLRVRRPRDRPSLLLKGLEMNDFMHRLLKTSNRRTVEPEAATADVFDQAPTDGGAPAVPEHSARLDATASEAPEADQASIEVGDQVAVILASAKQAAQRLHDSALQEAEHVREEAKRDADARLEVAGQELAERREEAETLRAEADAYSKSMREAADLHAAETGRKLDVELEQRRRDAEREANEIRRAAKLRADELASEALRRRGAIITEAERSEARLEQLLDVFRTVTSQLEDVLNERKALTGETRDLDEALRARTAGNPPA